MKNRLRNSNITKNRTRVALFFVLAASAIGLAPAFSPSAQAYSINDVSGNYVDLNEGWTYGGRIGNFKQIVPFSQLGLVTFTPATGTFHADWIARAYGENGEVMHDGTYIVDANGHGTMTWVSVSGNTKQSIFTS